MSAVLGFWKNLSISKKLYFVVGAMAILITGELVVLRFAMHSLSALRAFVEGEGTWSKAQKDAAFNLQRYASSRDEQDYQAFLGDFKVPEGDHQARLELMRPQPDLAQVRGGFLAGQIHPEDIDPMIELLRRYSRVSYLNHAIDEWSEGDRLLGELKSAGENYHQLIQGQIVKDPQAMRASLARIRSLNDQLTQIEVEFSRALGAGSRWLEHLVISVLCLAVLCVESIGLTLTYLTSRMISRGLNNLNGAAEKIGAGDFSSRLEVHSMDEIGLLTVSVNKMGELLQKSYGELESRVTERTRELSEMATENSRLYQEAKAAVLMREEFLSIASHELKTPLTSQYIQLQMLSKLAKGAPDSPAIVKIREYVDFSLAVAKKQQGLIEELMDLSRLQAGKFEIHPEIGDWVAAAREAVRVFTQGNPLTDERIVFSQHEPKILTKFDQLRMSQVVTNLVSNALKYGGVGKVEVDVRLVRGADGDRAQLSVRDYGPGISASVQEKIFERFERFIRDKGVSGLGLGLYICRQIVEAHGGKISVQSREGEGANFTVEVPIVT